MVVNNLAILSCVGFYNAFCNLKNRTLSLSELAANTFPVAVNGAFACELAMKGFLDKNVAKTHSHHLAKLFNEPTLPQEFKDKVLQKYDGTFEELTTAISEADNVFVDWRFYYEGKKSGISLPDGFYKMVDAFCIAAHELSEL